MNIKEAGRIRFCAVPAPPFAFVGIMWELEIYSPSFVLCKASDRYGIWSSDKVRPCRDTNLFFRYNPFLTLSKIVEIAEFVAKH